MTLSTSTLMALASYLGRAAAHAKLLLVPDPHSIALNLPSSNQNNPKIFNSGVALSSR